MKCVTGLFWSQSLKEVWRLVHAWVGHIVTLFAYRPTSVIWAPQRLPSLGEGHKPDSGPPWTTLVGLPQCPIPNESPAVRQPVHPCRG